MREAMKLEPNVIYCPGHYEYALAVEKEAEDAYFRERAARECAEEADRLNAIADRLSTAAARLRKESQELLNPPHLGDEERRQYIYDGLRAIRQEALERGRSA